MNELTNVITNEIVEVNVSNDIYSVASNINNVLCLLSFFIISYFIYQYIKSCYGRKR